MNLSIPINKFGYVFKKQCMSLKVVFLFSIPIILSRLLIAMQGIVSTLLIAHFGHDQFAASTLISATLSPILIFFMTSLYPISVMVGNAQGAGNSVQINQIVRQGWVLGSTMALAAFFLLPNLGFILLFFHQPSQLIHYVNEYLSIMKWGILPLMLSTGCQQFFLAITKATWVTLCHFFSLVLLVVCSYFFSFTTMGMQGIAYANVLTYWIILGIQLTYIILNPDIKKFELFAFNTIIHTTTLRQLFQMGWPISIQFGIEWIVFSLLTCLIGVFGETALIAQQITLQVNLLAMMVPFGIAQACAVGIGRARGLEEYETLNTIIRSGLILGSIFSFIVSYIYIAHPEFIIGLYLDPSLEMNTAIVNLACLMFVITAISQWLDSIRNIIIGILRGYFDTRTSMWVGIIMSCFISLPSGYCLGFILDYGAVGVKAGSLCGFALGVMILIYKLQQLQNKPLYCHRISLI